MKRQRDDQRLRQRAVALVRNLVPRSRSPEHLAADLDWLYGWKAG